MNTGYRLAERAVLMQVSMGLPGRTRKDENLSSEVKETHKMSEDSGAFIKVKYPVEALKPIEKIHNEARVYHDAVTLPWNKGIGILPGPLVFEYGEKMKEFAFRIESLVQNHFRAKYSSWVLWAKKSHNGTFDLSDYPGCSGFEADGTPIIDEDGLDELCEAFYFKTEPLPVPDKGHFEATMRGLLGASAEAVNIRVKDAMAEAHAELMKRLIAPVRAMVAKLNEPVKDGKKSQVFRDSLVGNIKEIVDLAPKLNISGDRVIDDFVKEIKTLTLSSPEDLRESEQARKDTAAAAKNILSRLEGYKL